MAKVIKYNSRDEWMQARNKGIGASEVGTILGLSPFETPYQLWMRKKGMTPPKAENEAMLMGHLLEDAVAQRFAIATGVHIIKSSVEDFSVIDEDKPYMRVSPDRTYWGQGVKRNEANKGLLECKTTTMEVSDDDIPMHWFCQLQYQLGVCGYSHGALAWINLGKRQFGMMPMDFDKDFFGYLSDKVTEFWKRYIIGDEVPEAYSVEDVVLQYPRHTEGKTITADDRIMADINELRDVREQLDKIKAKKDAIEADIKKRMQDAEAVVTDDGQTLVTWRAPKVSAKLDAKLLQQEHPKIYNKYCHNVQGARRFLIK